MKITKNGLARLHKCLTKHNLILGVKEVERYYDEPHSSHFSCKLVKSPIALTKELWKVNTYGFSSSGLSLGDRERGLGKVLGEAAERICQCAYNLENLSHISRKDFANNPIDLSFYTQNTTLDSKEIAWVKGRELFSKKTTYVPAQLVYLFFQEEEPRIVLHRISTGGAGAYMYEDAIYSGLLEVIERDAIMTAYLLRAPLPHYDLSKDPHLQSIYKILKEYRLEWHLFDATNDIQVPVYWSIVVDTTGKGCALSIGAHAGFDPIECAVRSLEEALMGRSWGRNAINKATPGNISRCINSKALSSLEDRAIYWAYPKSYTKLAYLLKNPKSTKLPVYRKVPLDSLVVKLKNRGYSSYATDITHPLIAESGYHVAKVIVPGLQPLYLDEHYRHIVHDRMKQSADHWGINHVEINTIPHPFL